MRRWLRNIGFLTLAMAVMGGGLYYTGYPYKSSLYMERVMDKSNHMINYESELSLSLAVDSEAETPSSLDKIDGSFLVINEKREGEKRLLTYDLTSQQEAFRGESYEDENTVIFKSPMYHRYIVFDDSAKANRDRFTGLKNTFSSAVLSNISNLKIETDVGANEVGIKTLSIPISSKELSLILRDSINSMRENIPYEHILYRNEQITNKLLQQSKSEKAVRSKFEGDKERIVGAFGQVLSHLTVKDSKLSLKVGHDKLITEVSLVIDFEYEESGIRVPLTLYVDASFWNVNKTIVEKPMVDPTNSMSYEFMTSDINYLENENLEMNSQPEEDDSHIISAIPEPETQKVLEDSMTLEELGDNFSPLLPDDKKSIKQNEE